MKFFMKKKNISLIGIFVGALFIVVGILSICGVLGGDTSYPGSAPHDYDSGYAIFKGDYYTYSVNNSAEAAAGARTAAYNLGDIADFLKIFCGLCSIGFGLISMCSFGMIFVECVNKEKENRPITQEEIEAIFSAAEEEMVKEENAIAESCETAEAVATEEKATEEEAKDENNTDE